MAEDLPDTPQGDSELSVRPHPREIVDWLVRGTKDQRYIDNIFVEMCQRLRAAGVPLARATVFFDTHNPEWLGARFLWKTGMTEADVITFDYGIETMPDFLESPMYEVSNGAPEVRKRLEPGHPATREYSIYDTLRREGLTDYIIWPLHHSLGKSHTVTFASDQAGGFSDAAVEALNAILPVFALVSEVRLKNVLARTYLETYVGRHASELILAGATTRGSGFTVSAAVMICDLRDFTAISDVFPRDDVIALLNGYFDAMAVSIARHGGEILKFMGDGLLAIFELSKPDAATNLMFAVSEAQSSVAALNQMNMALLHKSPEGIHVVNPA
jgi:adenylate cyclase